MQLQSTLVFIVTAFAIGGDAAVCWTNGFNMLTGGQPWGSNCQQNTLPIGPKPPVNPCPPPPPPVTITATITTTSVVTTTSSVTETTTETTTTTTTTATTTTSYGINPATVAFAASICGGMNPPRATPMFDKNGNPTCCGPINGVLPGGGIGQVCP